MDEADPRFGEGCMTQKRLLGLLIFLCLLGIQVNGAQAQQPVVYAVLFFLPSCGHCHYVITEFLPPLQEEYGEQLQVLYIDVSQPEGRTLFYAACDTFEVPDDRCGYVPTLVIGTTVLVGSQDIPEQMPALVRNGIAAGGTGLPPIPGLRESYEAAVGGEQVGDTQDDPPESAPISTTYQETTWQDRLNQDRLGNGLGIGVLGVLVIGLVVQLGYGTRLLIEDEIRHWDMGDKGWLLVLGLAMMTTVIAGTLALDNSSFSLPAVLAAGVTFGMALVVWAIGHVDRHSGQTGYTFPGWLLPVTACLGLVVASYLAYVEIGENEAVCGAVGDCNAVQQSEYAELFGLIPIGLLGVFGYVMILAVWVFSRRASGWIGDAAQAILLGLALFGTAFSIYLTFLEPFVIGATCAWCLTSAMLMILMLCLQAPAGWTAVNRLVVKLTRWPYRTNQPDW
jgi:uncharacterized membrane protein/thiol-disulfide isomerase/thioredoxin